MVTLTFDGTFNGFLTVVYEIYRKKYPYFIIKRDGEPQEFLYSHNKIYIAALKERALRVKKGLKKKLGPEKFEIVRQAFLSGYQHIENPLFYYIKKGLESGPEALEDPGDPEILLVTKMAAKTHREFYKFIGLIRFETWNNGFIYGKFEPETYVLPLIGNHFKGRYAQMNWCLHDLTHKHMLFYKDGKLKILKDRPLKKEAGSSEEPRYSALWKEYFSVLSVENRENPELRKQNLPLKYRKHMTEFSNG